MPEEMLAQPLDPKVPGFTYDLRRLIEMLRRGWRLLAASLALSLTIAIVYLFVTTTLYQARARLLIVHQQGRPLNVVNPDPNRPSEGTEEFIPTQAEIISSHVVVKRAIDTLGLENLPTLLAVKEKGRDPVMAAIDKHLKVFRPDRMANVLQVEFRASSPEEATRLVEAITASYKKFLEDKYPRNSEAIALANKARRELAVELEDAEKNYVDFRMKNPLLVPDEKGRSLMTTRLETWDRFATAAQVRQVQLRSQLEIGGKLAKEGVGLWAIVHAMNQVVGDPNEALLGHTVNVAQINSLDYVRQLSKEQQELAERFGPQYSRVEELQERMARIQERTRESRGRYEQVEISDLLKSLEQSLKASQAMCVEMNKYFTESKKLEADFLVENRLRNNLERRRALFNAAVDQLRQAQLAIDYSPVAAEILEAANALPSPVYPRPRLALGLAILLGTAVGTGLLALQNQLRARLCSAQDIREALGLTVLGQVPQLASQHAAQAGTAALASHTLPTSPLAEAFKMLRTNLALLRRSQDLQFQVLVVTSPNPTEGKTTTASNLAICLAHAGQRTLLIDADLRNPSLDRLYNLPRNQGLTRILQGAPAAAEIVQSDSIAKLALIAAGPRVLNPAEELMSPHLMELLHEVRSRYDTIIIDSSPLLTVTDPCILASAADGVLLVVQDGVTRREDAEKAVELLQALDTPLLGAVLNGRKPARMAWGDNSVNGAEVMAAAGVELASGSPAIDLGAS